jgi:hypothetical protein
MLLDQATPRRGVLDVDISKSELESPARSRAGVCLCRPQNLVGHPFTTLDRLALAKGQILATLDAPGPALRIG